jgi:Mn2+/Fe2+ NRAMP family transporter
MMKTEQRKNLLQTLGPGILFASTAIGVSHLVQSTRAGAEFGFGLVWAIVLANLFKYPFFEFGSRYANATGESLIDGYRKVGQWMLVLYFLMVIASMFFVTAAVGVVTAGFMDNLFGIGNLKWVTVVLFISSLAILIIGKYKWLDSMIKVVGAVLLTSTLIAFVLTLCRGAESQGALISTVDLTDAGTFMFVIALMGWMPTAVDLSTWNSLWTLERIRQTGYHPTLRQTLADFNFGYLVSAFLSICFVTLGAFLIYGTQRPLSASSANFANDVVALFTESIGNWSYFLIATAAFSIMFGTCIAVFDGYARALERSITLLAPSLLKSTGVEKDKVVYITCLILIGLGSYLLIHHYLFLSVFLPFVKPNSSGFIGLVDIATTISFVIAPIIAIVNFRLVTWKHYPKHAAPPLWLRILAVLGIIFLTGFSIVYVLFKLGNGAS